jgi:hypothetical protein
MGDLRLELFHSEKNLYVAVVKPAGSRVLYMNLLFTK